MSEAICGNQKKPRTTFTYCPTESRSSSTRVRAVVKSNFSRVRRTATASIMRPAFIRSCTGSVATGRAVSANNTSRSASRMLLWRSRPGSELTVRGIVAAAVTILKRYNTESSSDGQTSILMSSMSAKASRIRKILTTSNRRMAHVRQTLSKVTSVARKKASPNATAIAAGMSWLDSARPRRSQPICTAAAQKQTIEIQSVLSRILRSIGVFSTMRMAIPVHSDCSPLFAPFSLRAPSETFLFRYELVNLTQPRSQNPPFIPGMFRLCSKAHKWAQET
jgi:hypothetical protein